MARQKQDDNRKYLDGNLTKVKALGKGVFEGIVATSAVDRHGEILEISGLDTDAYMSTNPIVLFGHDYWEAESVIGKALSLSKTKGGQLLSQFELFIDDNPKAALVGKLIKKGVLALSIGFVPTDVEGNRYTRSEMVEYSVVPVPANAQAAITARSLDLNKKELAILTDEIAKVKDIDMATTNTKGAVEDELTAEAAWEAKWDNVDVVWDIVYAFCDVYFDEDTPVTDFSKLLTETAGLLQRVASGTYVDPADEDADEVIETTVSSALKDFDRTKIKELIDAKVKSISEKTDDESEEETEDAKTESKTARDIKAKSITADADVAMFTQLAADMKAVGDKMHAMAEGVTAKIESDNPAQATGMQDEIDQSTGNNTGTPEASNTVKATKNKDNKPIDISGLKVDNLPQLAKMLKDFAVAVEEKAAQAAASNQATDADSHATVRKRRLILRETKVQARKADKVVELILSELKKN